MLKKMSLLLRILFILTLAVSCKTSAWYKNYGVQSLEDFKSPDSIQALLNAMDDPDADVRITAIRYLSNYHGNAGKEAEQKLNKIANYDPNRNVKKQAMLASYYYPSSIPILKKNITDPNPNTRKAAARYLGMHGDKVQDLKEILSIASMDENANVRTEARTALDMQVKKNITGYVKNSTCQKVLIDDGSQEIILDVRRGITKYIPYDFRALNGDKVAVTYFESGSNIVMEMKALEMIAERDIVESPALGEITEYATRLFGTNWWHYKIKFRDTGREYLFFNPKVEDQLAKGDKVKVTFSGKNLSSHNCYVYRVVSIEKTTY